MNGPAVFVNFSVSVKESNKVWLQWNVDSTEEGDYFIIERATEGSHYEDDRCFCEKRQNNDHYE